MDERGHCCLSSGKDLTQGKSDGGQAEQLRAGKGRKISFWREAMEGSHGGQREKAGGMEKRREARYLLPCLSESTNCQKVEHRGRKTERQRKKKVGEETRASYCD